MKSTDEQPAAVTTSEAAVASIDKNERRTIVPQYPCLVWHWLSASAPPNEEQEPANNQRSNKIRPRLRASPLISSSQHPLICPRKRSRLGRRPGPVTVD
jgi:hypothetical protein